MPDILAEIIAHKRLEVSQASAQRPLEAVIEAARQAPPPRDIVAALTAPGPRIIAECKRRSPSRGLLRDPYHPVDVARAYERAGAATISVLTDERFFGGCLADMTAVRDAVAIPVLRKDFIISPYQIYEARAAGADAFLLISGPLSTEQLEEFIELGRSLGMEPLIESHNAAEFTAALATSGRIFGINNRNLKNFDVDLNSSAELATLAALRRPTPIMVCESGIKSAVDIELMQGVGYKVFLIGEALVTQSDPEAALRSLIANTP